MSHRLSPAEVEHVSGILTEALERLEVLSLIAPSQISSEPEDVSDLINEEISRIIEEQRKLQTKYESLIQQVYSRLDPLLSLTLPAESTEVHFQ